MRYSSWDLPRPDAGWGFPPNEEGDGVRVGQTVRSLILIGLSVITVLSAQYDSKVITTATMSARLTNIGVLDWYATGEAPVQWIYADWLYGEHEVEFTHSIWLTGLMDDTLIGTTSTWSIDYSPGPILDGQAAMISHPEDENLYRVYHIDKTSGPGDTDYDEWPVKWGAPHYPDGTPLVYGSQTTYMVYNDAHTGDDYRGYPYSDPTPLEIHETVWDYGETPDLENVIFFRYQVYNRGISDIKDAAFAFWSDIDLYDPDVNRGGYNSNGNYMYIYYWHTDEGLFPRASTYVLLQGPVVPATGEMAVSFGQDIPDAENLTTTSGWYIFDDRYWDLGDTLAYMPNTLEQLRNITIGRLPNGDPIIHPITKDTTTYTYDGNPVTGEGWLWNVHGLWGGTGFVSSSSMFDLSAGDSTEAIYALVVAVAETTNTALIELENQVLELKQWWSNYRLNVEEIIEPIPIVFRLHQNFPNPFNPVTTIRYELPRSSHVRLSVYDILGREVTQLVDTNQNPGVKEVQWNASNVPSGIYFVQMIAGDFRQVRKVMVLK